MITDSTLNMGETDLNSTDISMSIDHIVEKIFESLETSDVKTYRFVCRRWARYGAKELQKRVTINLRKDNNSEDWVELNSLPTPSQDKTLQNLSTLIQNSSKFPCDSFRFYVGRLSDLRLQSFLDNYGHLIRKLAFWPLNVSRGEVNSECVIVGSLKKLLVSQTVNLQYLELHMGVSSGPGQNQQGHEEVKVGEDNSSQLLPACQSHIPNDQRLNTMTSSGNINVKLKVLKIWNHLPNGIFDPLIEIVPNLREVALENKDLHYLIRPVNRIHLLRKLELGPNKDTIDVLEMIASNSQGIQLNEVSFHFSLSLFSQQELWPRVVRVINQILESSANSLKKVTWRRSRFLPGIIFPVMELVKEIQMIHYSSRFRREQEDQLENHSYHYCTQGLELYKIFPGLETVRIIFKYRYQVEEHAETVGQENSDGSNNTSLFNSTPVQSVKYVYVENLDANQVSARFMAEYLQRFSYVFPNAKVVTC